MADGQDKKQPITHEDDDRARDEWREFARENAAELDEICGPTTATPEEQRAAADRWAARGRYQREAEERALEWCRRHWGSLEGPDDPIFGVMLAQGGLVALLMRADLSTQAGADHFFTTHSTVAHTLPSGERVHARPTLEQLRMAKAIAAGLETAIFFGDDPNAWDLVRRAYESLFAKQDALRNVVSIVTDLRQYQERQREVAANVATMNRRPLPEHPGTGLEFRASRALEQLANLDSRFATVCACEVVALIEDAKLEPIGIAVQLTARCNAFDFAPRSDGKAEARTKHIRDAYDAAERTARRIAARAAASKSPTD